MGVLKSSRKKKTAPLLEPDSIQNAPSRTAPTNTKAANTASLCQLDAIAALIVSSLDPAYTVLSGSTAYPIGTP